MSYNKKSNKNKNNSNNNNNSNKKVDINQVICNNGDGIDDATLEKYNKQLQLFNTGKIKYRPIIVHGIETCTDCQYGEPGICVFGKDEYQAFTILISEFDSNGCQCNNCQIRAELINRGLLKAKYLINFIIDIYDDKNLDPVRRVLTDKNMKKGEINLYRTFLQDEFIFTIADASLSGNLDKLIF